MKSQTVKRVFLAALALCLILVCALSAGDAKREEAPTQRALDNASLSLRVDDDGLVTIEGEGKLTAADMRTLLEGASLDARQVKDMIIGDGIDEIGYNAINGFTAMQTLKLGAGVGVVDNGAIKSCTGLKYVFIPSGIRAIGKDFLFRSSDVVVATDAPAKGLPKMKYVSKKRVLYGVDSFEALVAAAETAGIEANDPDHTIPEACRRWWQQA